MLHQAPMTLRSTSPLYPAATFLMAAAIFLTDTLTPLDTAIAVLYVVVVMVSANFLHRKGVMAVGALCAALTLASFAIVHGGSDGSEPLIRCLVSLCAIGITVLLTLGNQQARLDLSDHAALLDLTHDAIFVRDGHDRITFWNAGAEALYGWGRDQAIGRQAAELLKTELPSAAEGVTQRLHAADRWEGVVTRTKRDGTAIVVASRWSLQRDERGHPVATMETNNDVSERRRAEDALHAAQAELSHVTRVTTLGELTASIAHEVNQPLAAVVTNGEACLRWLLRETPDLDEVRGSVERMISNGRRASEVVAHLRALARKSDPQQVWLRLNEIVDSVLLLVERELSNHRVAVRLDLDPSLPRLLGDRVQLQQVIINLVMNAVQAMSTLDRPRLLSIGSRGQGLDGDAPSVVLEVRDNGVGIDASAAARLFVPFYTTRSDGMGMGLSICRSIVEAHGGQICVRPESGPGACFVVRLPVRQGAPS